MSKRFWLKAKTWLKIANAYGTPMSLIKILRKWDEVLVIHAILGAVVYGDPRRVTWGWFMVKYLENYIPFPMPSIILEWIGHQNPTSIWKLAVCNQRVTWHQARDAIPVGAHFPDFWSLHLSDWSFKRVTRALVHWCITRIPWYFPSVNACPCKLVCNHK